MGRFIREQLTREGVDTRGVITDPDRLTALVLLGIRDEDRFPLIFYRENCADMALSVDDIDESLIMQARALLPTGTHLSHPRTEAAVLKALRLARKHGLKTALDIDYRPNLWGVAGHGDGESRFVESAAVTTKQQSHLHFFNLIVGTEEEFHIAGGTTDTIAALRAVRAVSDAVLVCKRGAAGAVAFDGDIPDTLDAGQSGPGFPIEVFNVLGAGDGFFSGLMKGWLDGADWPTTLTYANACCAFAVSRHGCTPAYPSLTELEFFLDRGVIQPDLRNDAALEQIHWSTNRARNHGPDVDDIRIFAFDHRMQSVWHTRRPAPDADELQAVADLIRNAARPVMIAGGGVHYADATATLAGFAHKHCIPVVESQAGKSALAWDDDWNFGPVGVTGAQSANDLCADADLIIGVGTRFQDFTTGSWGLFHHPDRTLVSINVAAYDAMKYGAVPLCADARMALISLTAALDGHTAPAPPAGLKAGWFAKVDPLTDAPQSDDGLPTDQQVIGAVQRSSHADTVVMSAAGTMPGELHKLWKAPRPGGYHMEYGFSCMGYEVAGAMGVKLVEPARDVICMVGDGSYMMANSELATAVMMGMPITVVVTDNRGYGRINRLQMGTGGAEFNNLYAHARVQTQPQIDFAAHAASMGGDAVKVTSIAELEAALRLRKDKAVPYVIVIDTDPYPSTPHGGTWWDVAVPEISARDAVKAARVVYDAKLKDRR